MPIINQDDWTLEKARAEAKRLFGEQRNVFYDHGRRRFYVGKFMTMNDRWMKNPDGSIRYDEERRPIERHPGMRRQVLYGSGRTLEEAFRFATGGRIYNLGYRPIYSEDGSLKAFISPAGFRLDEIPEAITDKADA